MFDQLAGRWWIVAARGLIAMAFGVVTFIAPFWSLGLLVSLFGLFALGDAIFTIGAGLSANWLSLFLDGIFGAVIGGLTLFYHPAAQLWVVAPMMVAWAFVTAALEFAAAVRLRHLGDGAEVTGEWLMAVSGVLSVAFGVLIALQPPLPTMTFAWTIATYAVLSGLLLVALAVNIRHWTRLSMPHA